MPYRRLPNTDQARIRAIQQAIEAYENFKQGEKAMSPVLFYNLKLKLTELYTAVFLYNEAFERQKNNSKILEEKFSVCKLYLSHFIQVVNFCILRNELPIEIRKFYQLSVENLNLPVLQTPSQIYSWGKIIIEGEILRGKEGGMRIENPSIGKVKAAFDAFDDVYNLHIQLVKYSKTVNNSLAKLRPQIDRLIKETWDSIENYFSNFPTIIRLEKCEQFGIKYFYRKNEDKIILDDILGFENKII